MIGDHPSSLRGRVIRPVHPVEIGEWGSSSSER